ncbi:MAG: alpha/beta fold hydrolase [Nitrospinota bacterium]
MAQAVCNDIQLSYDDSNPTGYQPAVVFLHGVTLNRGMWEPQQHSLRGRFRVIAYDLRGHGRSEKPRTGYGRAEEVRDLLALLDHLRLSRAALVGLGRGASIALDFALQHPDRTRALVLMAPPVDTERFVPEMVAHWTRAVDTLRENGLRAAREFWLGLDLYAPAREKPEMARALEEMVGLYTGPHWIDPDPPSNPSLAEVAAELRRPALVLIGERDLQGFHNAADYLSEKLPQGEKRSIADAGHLVSLEAPEEVNRALGEFLAKSAG